MSETATGLSELELQEELLENMVTEASLRKAVNSFSITLAQPVNPLAHTVLTVLT